MATYTIVPDGLRAYGVERSSSGSFRSVRGFATAEDAQTWIDQDRINEQEAKLRLRAELRRRAAALMVRATAARERAAAAVERSASTRALAAQARQRNALPPG
jgi:hypothetical protein